LPGDVDHGIDDGQVARGSGSNAINSLYNKALSIHRLLRFHRFRARKSVDCRAPLAMT
jgi:hypothetical protein